MSLENTLDRIATALENIARLAPIANPDPPKAQPQVIPEGKVGEPYVETPARTRGRPRKAEAQTSIDDPAPPAAAPAPAASDMSFLDGPEPEKELTYDDVRDALTKYQRKMQNPETARKLLKDVGGVDELKHLPKDKFAAVIKAAGG